MFNKFELECGEKVGGTTYHHCIAKDRHISYKGPAFRSYNKAFKSNREYMILRFDHSASGVAIWRMGHRGWCPYNDRADSIFAKNKRSGISGAWPNPKRQADVLRNPDPIKKQKEESNDNS